MEVRLGVAAGGTGSSLVLGVGGRGEIPDVADSVAYLTGQWFLFLSADKPVVKEERGGGLVFWGFSIEEQSSFVIHQVPVLFSPQSSTYLVPIIISIPLAICSPGASSLRLGFFYCSSACPLTRPAFLSYIMP